MKRLLCTLFAVVLLCNGLFAENYYYNKKFPFGESDTVDHVIMIVISAGLVYGGYMVLTKADDPGVIGYAAGGTMFLGGGIMLYGSLFEIPF